MTACTKSQYPYPDENIFFITGVNTDVQPIDYSKTTPLIIVSRKPEVALAKLPSMRTRRAGSYFRRLRFA
jgi:hypothetical protein